MKKHPTVAALEKASKGLLLPSESEAPFQPFLWQDAGAKLSRARLRELMNADEGESVEELSLDELFQTVPSEDQKTFQKLADTLEQQLSGVKVYKVGDEPERKVYIVGKTADGALAGLQTTVVET
jgi:histidine triad (HIT) family protein